MNTVIVPETMKAVRIHKYGSASELTLDTIPVPSPNADDVLIKVQAASVNPVDWKVREGYLTELIPHSLPLTLGWDVAGEIVTLGSNVTDLSVGDAIYSRPDISRDGSHAEFMLVNYKEVAAKPQSLTWQEAASVPLAALTAWQSLIDTAHLASGQRVLIHAGAGGVGGFAIQLAKNLGAYVITTCSSKNIDYVKSLGADEVIDYTEASFETLRDIDVVFDTLGGDIQVKSWSVLKPGGRLVSICDTPSEALAEQHGANGYFVFVQANRDQLDKLRELIDADKIQVRIDSEFNLSEVANAHARSESGRATGKIIINF